MPPPSSEEIGRTWGEDGLDLDAGEVDPDFLLLWLKLRLCFMHESAKDDRRDLMTAHVNLTQKPINWR